MRLKPFYLTLPKLLPCRLLFEDISRFTSRSFLAGLKLIANVTYGYTAANFSGRMPCVEVGDSVVSKGRETLERAIKLVRESTQWNAKVSKLHKKFFLNIRSIILKSFV